MNSYNKNFFSILGCDSSDNETDSDSDNETNNSSIEANSLSMKNLKRLITSIVFGSFLVAANYSEQAKASAREVRVYSGRHYNTDRQVFKKFSKETGIKVRLIEATGISLVERLKREGSNSNADLILLVDAARITIAAKSGLLQTYRSSKLEKEVPKQYRDMVIKTI